MSKAGNTLTEIQQGLDTFWLVFDQYVAVPAWQKFLIEFCWRDAFKNFSLSAYSVGAAVGIQFSSGRELCGWRSQSVAKKKNSLTAGQFFRSVWDNTPEFFSAAKHLPCFIFKILLPVRVAFWVHSFFLIWCTVVWKRPLLNELSATNA